MVNFYDSWGSSVRKGQDTPAQDEEPSKAPNSALVAEVEALLVDGPDLSDADDADEEEPEFERVKMGPKLRLGSACPMFRAADSKGISFNVEDTFRRGRKLLIFFYPKGTIGHCLLHTPTRHFTHTHAHTHCLSSLHSLTWWITSSLCR